MGYFNDVLMFLGLEHGCSVAVWVRKHFIKNIYLCSENERRSYDCGMTFCNFFKFSNYFHFLLNIPLICYLKKKTVFQLAVKATFLTFI